MKKCLIFVIIARFKFDSNLRDRRSDVNLKELNGWMKSVINGDIREVKVAPEARSEPEKGRPFLRAVLLLQHRERDVSGGSTVVIDLEEVMASFYALV